MNTRGELLNLLFSDVAVAIVVFLGYVYTEPFRTGPTDCLLFTGDRL